MFSLRIHSLDPSLLTLEALGLSNTTLPLNPDPNQNFQIVQGIVHLYRQLDPPPASSYATAAASSPSHDPLLPPMRGDLLFVLAIADTVSPDDFVSHCSSYIQKASRVTFIRNDGMEDCYSLLIKFDDQMAADRFYVKLHGRRFPSSDAGLMCHVLFLTSAEFTQSLEIVATPPVGSTELPPCSICIERMDQDITGIVATTCDHSFQCSCVSKWVNSSCPVCQFCQNLSAEPICSVCETNESLYICVICGFVGCGRYKEGHALKHWKNTQHCYTLDLKTHWIWDYVGNDYVHRNSKSSSCKTYSLRQGEIRAGSYILPIKKPLGISNSVSQTSVFTSGGHQWAVGYYVNKKFIEVEISLYSNSINVYAIPDITLLDKDGMLVEEELLSKIKTKAKVHHFPCRNVTKCWEKFINRDKFEAFLKNNCLVGVISITVLSSGSCGPSELTVPPSNLHTHLRKLLDDKERSDVSFEVEGQLICAHKLVLAARSPVFKAQLSGPLQEGCSKPIEIQDMQAVVFKAMLHFIYTDLLPDEMEDHEDNPEDKIGSVMLTQHMLVAADRYGLERLKLICEDNLCRHICTDTVAISLTLAEQHNCRRLKRLCFCFAAKPENYIQMTFSEGYAHMMRSCPSLIQEFRRSLINPRS